MRDPALLQSMAQLSALLKRLHAASETLNSKIAEFEKLLVEMEPGITAWCPDLLRQPAGVLGGAASQLGFTKGEKEWGLFVRRGTFRRSPPNGWRYDPNLSGSMVRLVDAGREERAAAVEQFPALVKAMTDTVRARVASLESASEKAQ